MTKLMTLGAGKKAKGFQYEGSIGTGVDLLFKAGKTHIDQSFFSHALQAFAGRSVKGGFKMDDPPTDGFGAWVQRESHMGKNRSLLSPRHASFMAAILCHEAGVVSKYEGTAVWLRFPETPER